MKKSFFLWLFIAAAFFANSQGKTLYTVNVVKPKAGMKSTFETNWKAHMALYHKTEDKRNVYEVVSGSHIGEYHIVEGPIGYADMDAEKPNAKAHGLDLEKNFSPYLKDETTNATYRHEDSLSFNTNEPAEKFQVTVLHFKPGSGGSYLREMKRSNSVSAKINPNPTNINPNRRSSNTYYQVMQGNKPVMVMIRSLKDGFKELDLDYFPRTPRTPNANPTPPGTDPFKDAYIKDFGQEAWDARTKFFEDNTNIESRESYLMKLRKDLSSQ